MGFFSFTCGECSHDMMHGHNPGYSKYTRGTVFFSDGNRMSGDYDGYGRLGAVDISEIDSGLGADLLHKIGGDAGYLAVGENRNASRGCVYKLVHEACLKKGMTFETIKGQTTHGNEQGFWPGERAAQTRWGPPELSEIGEDNTYVCFECKRVWDAKWSAGACPFGCERPDGLEDYEETVQAFDYKGDGKTNALAICRNPSYVFKPYSGDAKDPENCWYFGKKQLIVGRLDNEQEQYKRECAEAEGKTFEWSPSCPGCKSSDHLEMHKLLRSPLEHLAAI